MAVNPSPFGPKPQFELSDGTPAVGNKLFFYVAGSVSTKQNTYNSSTGLSANTNPIILNALGQPTNAEIWFTAGLSYKVVYAPSTDTDPPSSPIWTIDNLLGINDVSVSQDQWVAFIGAPTFVGATSFTLVGDQTSAFHVGRRLKTTNSGGTVYSTITISAFAAVTTVTVVNDSGSLDAGLSAVSYGLLSATNPSTPLLTDAYPIVSGSADKTKKVRLEADGLTTATIRVVTVSDRDFIIGKQPTRQFFTSGSGTYTTASGATRIYVRMVGGGGGGGAAHNITPTAGGNGGNTTFSTFTAGGGVGGQKGDGAATAGGGAGGTASGGNVNLAGGAGTGSGAPLDSAGGSGGASAFGGNGGGGQPVNSNGTAGATNTGGGGGGAGGSSGAFGGGGGGSGAYVEAWISAPSATYSYGVGAAGAAGTSAADSGGAGGSGLIIVEEFYD